MSPKLPDVPQSWFGLSDRLMQILQLAIQLAILLSTIVGSVVLLRTGQNIDKKVEEHGVVLEKAAEKADVAAVKSEEAVKETKEVKKAVEKMQ